MDYVMRNFLTYNIFLVTYKHLTITVIELLLAQCQDTAGLCETTERFFSVVKRHARASPSPH